MNNLHKALSDPDRLRLMDYIASVGKPVYGREIARKMAVSERWVSRALHKLASADLLVRIGDAKMHAWANWELAPDIRWPLGMSAAMHYALVNVNCIRIMDFLKANPGASVGDVVKAIGVKQGTISKYLATLDRAGLIQRSRDDQTVRNSIAPGVVWPVKVTT